ncbi:acyl-CoA dehydrogenase family protein [Streptomyces sp. TRM 70361]|uniref:acyl-CoA dehydrogenase family protein n=1 Tax=Streptomyces sp. TRM 70361 TaxID=3116553 RepID=UPI002E7C3A9E|nr:acyl-CoA dehydrogenase family protein [Streptomyces sp. TRM 70361]MEE1943036.1 acyl-CoA dehydrogenase family protein [Streptomyces sp. TRM 70361]
MTATTLGPGKAASAPADPDGPVGLHDRVASVAAVAAEHAQRHDRDATFPVEALAELRRTGLLGLLVPTRDGGLGGAVKDMVEASTVLGRTDLSTAMIFAMHCQQVATVVRYAHGPLRAELLPQIAAGQRYLASVTTETGKGGHLLSSQSPLGTEGGDLLVDRFAPVVTGGRHADGYLITVQSPQPDSEHQVSLVYARRDQLTVERHGRWQPLGMRASDSGALRLTGRVPPHQTVGAHGSFATMAKELFAPMAHLGWSACWLGTSAGALSRVLKLLRSPQGRNRTDLGSDLLLTRLAETRQRLDAVHALLQRAQRVVAAGGDLSLPRVQLLLNTLKVTASEDCHQAVQILIDALGMRHGYLGDSPTGLERALRDLRSASLNYSNDRLRLADGRLALLDPEVRFG